jgi:hypothetical protein
MILEGVPLVCYQSTCPRVGVCPFCLGGGCFTSPVSNNRLHFQQTVNCGLFFSWQYGQTLVVMIPLPVPFVYLLLTLVSNTFFERKIAGAHALMRSCALSMSDPSDGAWHLFLEIVKKHLSFRHLHT